MISLIMSVMAAFHWTCGAGGSELEGNASDASDGAVVRLPNQFLSQSVGSDWRSGCNLLEMVLLGQVAQYCSKNWSTFESRITGWHCPDTFVMPPGGNPPEVFLTERRSQCGRRTHWRHYVSQLAEELEIVVSGRVLEYFSMLAPERWKETDEWMNECGGAFEKDWDDQCMRIRTCGAVS